MELVEPAAVVGLAPRFAQPGLDERPVSLGQVIGDVAFFVGLLAIRW